MRFFLSPARGLLWFTSYRHHTRKTGETEKKARFSYKVCLVVVSEK